MEVTVITDVHGALVHDLKIIYCRWGGRGEGAFGLEFDDQRVTSVHTEYNPLSRATLSLFHPGSGSQTSSSHTTLPDPAIKARSLHIV